MSSGVRDCRDGIVLLEQEAHAAVAALYRIRSRTSRVLTATSSFEKFAAEVRSFEQAVRTLTELSPANRDSVDAGYVSRELARLRAELDELRGRFGSELAQAPAPARIAAAPRKSKPRKPWWKIWK